jgi:hypothetical protein
MVKPFYSDCVEGKIKVIEICEPCHGTGWQEGFGLCPDCGGEGNRIYTIRCNINECDNCGKK